MPAHAINRIYLRREYRALTALSLMPVREILEKYLPKFCWQTQGEVYDFVRVARPGASAPLILHTLYKLRAAGKVRVNKYYDGANERLEYRGV